MKRWLVRIGIGVAGLAGFLVALILLLGIVSVFRQERRYAIAIPPIGVPSDPATVARGRHLVTAVGGCTGCHAQDFGGRVLLDKPLLARLVATNLTRGRGGVAGGYTDQDFVRAIRHGVGRNDKSLC